MVVQVQVPIFLILAISSIPFCKKITFSPEKLLYLHKIMCTQHTNVCSSLLHYTNISLGDAGLLQYQKANFLTKSLLSLQQTLEHWNRLDYLQSRYNPNKEKK